MNPAGLHALDDLTTTAILMAFWAGVVMLAVLPFFWRWWMVPLGRALVTLDVSVMIITFPKSLNYMTGTPISSQWYAWVVVIASLTLGPSIVWRTWMIIRLQLSPGAEHRPARNLAAVRAIWRSVRRSAKDDKEGPG